MKGLLLLCAAIFATAYAGRHLGCWRDHSHRAIAGGIRFRGSPGRCEVFARNHGWRVFAVQYGGECFTGPHADRTYRKYGRAGNCRHGRGGGWANDVYEVSHWRYYYRLHHRAHFMRIYRHRYLHWRRVAAAQKRRLTGYNRRYVATWRNLHRYGKLNRYWVRRANGQARVSNALRRSHAVYVRRYKAYRGACNRTRRKLLRSANYVARRQRASFARYRSYRGRAIAYKRRYNAARRLLRARAIQRRRAYIRYNKYVRTANVYRSRYIRWHRIAAAQRRRLGGYNSRLAAARRYLNRTARLNRYWVRRANAQARRSNALRRSHAAYVRRYRAYQGACNRGRRRLVAAANRTARRQHAYYARYRSYRRRALLYRNRYNAARRLYHIRLRQKARAYRTYNKYVHAANYWARKYRAIAHHG